MPTSDGEVAPPALPLQPGLLLRLALLYLLLPPALPLVKAVVGHLSADGTLLLIRRGGGRDRRDHRLGRVHGGPGAAVGSVATAAHLIVVGIGRVLKNV